MPEIRDLSLLKWARQNGVEFRVRVLLDNHEPNRKATALTGYAYTHNEKPMSLLVVGEEIPKPTEAIYLLDDGLGVQALYPVCWALEGTPARPDGEPLCLTLSPFPLSIGVRADNGEPIDMSGWALGPRRAYHCKVQL